MTKPRRDDGRALPDRIVGQKVRLIVEGVGSDDGLEKVTFEIIDVTSYAGYSGNTTDAAIKGAGKEKDVSFSNANDLEKFVVTPTTTAAEGGELEANRVWANLWIKDYAAYAEARATLDFGGGKTKQMILKVPESTEDPLNGQTLDNISDQWERDRWDEYVSVFGISGAAAEFGIDKFFAGYDAELNDPDGAGPQTTHKAAGDDLTVLQEYRGFILDGGGFDGSGKNPHKGGHIRLSPARKELLVEVDAMKDVVMEATDIDVDDLNEEETVAWEKAMIAETMDQVSRGFSNKTVGAGIWMYYVLDKLQDEHRNIPLQRDESTYLRYSRNPALVGEFVHLFLATRLVGEEKTYGHTVKDGSMVFVERLMNKQPLPGTGITKDKTNFVALVSKVIAHELTHTIIREDGTNGFDNDEHLDGDDGSFLMATNKARGIDVKNWTKIKFSDTTRKTIDLTNKQLRR